MKRGGPLRDGHGRHALHEHRQEQQEALRVRLPVDDADLSREHRRVGAHGGFGGTSSVLPGADVQAEGAGVGLHRLHPRHDVELFVAAGSLDVEVGQSLCPHPLFERLDLVAPDTFDVAEPDDPFGVERVRRAHVVAPFVQGHLGAGVQQAACAVNRLRRCREPGFDGGQEPVAQPLEARLFGPFDLPADDLPADEREGQPGRQRGEGQHDVEARPAVCLNRHVRTVNRQLRLRAESDLGRSAGPGGRGPSTCGPQAEGRDGGGNGVGSGITARPGTLGDVGRSRREMRSRRPRWRANARPGHPGQRRRGNTAG